MKTRLVFSENVVWNGKGRWVTVFIATFFPWEYR